MNRTYFYLRFPGGKPKCITLSYDDGVEQDIRLIALMEQYGFKGTFNLNYGKSRRKARCTSRDASIVR